MRKLDRGLLRDLEASDNIDILVVSAAATILIVRFGLHLLKYPTIGGAALHIAHVLWGGAFMLAALVLLFSYVDRRVMRVAAWVGGIGFGLFIDELGKFLTHENDYFFQPTVALIYLTLVGVYLAGRTLQTRMPTRREEYLTNALWLLQEVVRDDLDAEERDRALEYIAHCDPTDPVAQSIAKVLDSATVVPARAPGPWMLWRKRLRGVYWYLSGQPWFGRALMVFFVGQLLVRLTNVVVVAFFHRPGVPFVLSTNLHGRSLDELTWWDWLPMTTTAVSAIFVLWGVVRLSHSRLAAFRMFERSVLVTILATQPFLFYQEEWSALTGLLAQVVVFVALRFAIQRERPGQLT